VGRATQASRGVIVGLVVIGLAAAAHLVGGGLPAPVSPGFVALALLSLVACAVLSHQEWTLVRQLVCLAGSQVVFHAVLEVERDAAGLRWPVQHPELIGSVEVDPSMLMTSPAHSERKVHVSRIALTLAWSCLGRGPRHGRSRPERVLLRELVDDDENVGVLG